MKKQTNNLPEKEVVAQLAKKEWIKPEMEVVDLNNTTGTGADLEVFSNS